MPIYSGRDGAVYLSTSASGTASNVMTLTSWSLDAATERQDVTNFDSTNQEQIQGWPGRSISYEGYWNSDESKLFAAAASADGCKMYLYPSKRVPSKFAAGVVWLDASIETRVDGAVRVRGTASAAGGGFVINL